MIDVDSLLQPMEGDSPCGPDLYGDSDQEFSDLEIACQGKAEQAVGDHVIEGQEPDWPDVRDRALALFARNKDLQVAVKLTRALTSMEGVRGLAQGTSLIRRLLETYWDTLHPRLEDDSDPWRMNILSELNSSDSVLKSLRNAIFAEARAVGRFTGRDIEVADGDIQLKEGETGPNETIIVAALRESGADTVSAVSAACAGALEDLKAIEAVFSDKQGTSPEFGALLTRLKRQAAVAALASDSGDAAAPIAEGEAGGGSETGGGGGAAGGGVAISGRVASRADAKRVLEQVCDYLDRYEPSHPAPLFIRRAIRLLDKSFIEIIQDLAPDALMRINDLSGSGDQQQSASE